MIVLLFVAGSYLLTLVSTANINITSQDYGTPWRTTHWGKMEHCPHGTFAIGFRLKTEPPQHIFDDTALNGIRLYCGPRPTEERSITSTTGDYGYWGDMHHQGHGILTGFQLNVEGFIETHYDQTAANNIRFFSKDVKDYKQGDGLDYGTWGPVFMCEKSQGICGIQTEVQPDVHGRTTHLVIGDKDDVMLMRVRFECCDFKP